MAGDGVTSELPQVFQFSTDAFRKHERVSAWREAFGRTLLNIDIAPKSPEDFRASATMFRVADLGLIRASTSAADQCNSPSLITNDNVCFGGVMDTQWSATQLGRSAEFSAGDAVLMSNCDVGALTFPDECRYTVFALPRALVAPLVPDLGAVFARRIPAESPALRMLMQYLQLGQDDHLASSPELQMAFIDHVCDLLALALGATRDAAELARTRGVSAARLRAMKEAIRKTCHRHSLSVHDIAAQYGVSARYVQRIFEQGGSTFTQYVTEQRLAAAYKALRRRTPAGLPISTLAYDCGFTDVSHFNRLFRQRFGCTPTDVRNAARSRAER
ncbi:AraC family transcriptional regulator [Rhodoplanes sp. Z2-YC6860]|uniref:AraC family transcriptional regulator n=1 Tax=Rhodoplanes sp. Z2-YC6860 TaxID=674703 RepID=UPI00078E1022|nr:AraC family transcriptional regulator [Rhodoplanes sp. Z2-YC6860]AMN41548.1 AraC family transcriptional regulator [Rhodoplanes sp. Z2-YC6860]